VKGFTFTIQAGRRHPKKKLGIVTTPEKGAWKGKTSMTQKAVEI
jgi:hypothetical protein